MNHELRERTWNTLIRARYAHLYLSRMVNRLRVWEVAAIAIPVVSLGLIAGMAALGIDRQAGINVWFVGISIGGATISMLINHLGLPVKAVQCRIYSKEVSQIALRLQQEYDAINRYEETSPAKLAYLQDALEAATEIVSGLPRKRERNLCWNILMDEIGQPEYRVT